MAIQCNNGDLPYDCGLPYFMTVTQGPSTMYYTVSESASYASIGCSLDGTVSAICIQSETGSLANNPGLTTKTYYQPSVYDITATLGNTGNSRTATQIISSGVTRTSTAASTIAPEMVTTDTVITQNGQTTTMALTETVFGSCASPVPSWLLSGARFSCYSSSASIAMHSYKGLTALGAVFAVILCILV